MRLKYMLYKVDCKQGCKFLPHGNKGLHNLQTPTKQEESNVQCLINLCVHTIHIKWKELEMVDKDVQPLLVDIWKSFQEWSDEIKYKVCIHNMWILWLSFFSKISVGVLVS